MSVLILSCRSQMATEALTSQGLLNFPSWMRQEFTERLRADTTTWWTDCINWRMAALMNFASVTSASISSHKRNTKIMPLAVLWLASLRNREENNWSTERTLHCPLDALHRLRQTGSREVG